jgi:hypothetical protein
VRPGRENDPGKQIMLSIKKLHFPAWTIPIALLGISFLSYGILSPWLGFYWDDWPAIWYLHTFGPAGFKEVFAIDRPLLGRFFMLTTPFLGDSMLAWQIFGILTRWASSLALWWTLRQVWPERIREATWVALLFTVYPGFTQQYIAVTYSHVLIILSIFLLSMGSMIWALRKPAWFWPLMVFSVLASAVTMFSVEYFFGLELLRPVLLWLVLSEKTQKLGRRIYKTLAVWAPYLATMFIFLLWRVLFSETPRGQVKMVDKLQTNPIQEIIRLAGMVTQDVFQSSLLAWIKPIDFSQLISFGTASVVLYAVLTLVSFVIALFYLAKLRLLNQNSQPPGRSFARLLIGLGIYALLVSGWPFWATHLPIELVYPWDRFTLPMMLGASLLVVGLLELLGNRRFLKVLLLSALIGLAVGFQFQHSNTYRRDWNTQAQFFWQMAWRAPAIQPGTLLLSSELPFVYFSDNSLTAPLNWLYAPDNISRSMDYMFYSIEARLGLTLPALQTGLPVEQDYRATSFKGNTSQALVLFYQPPGCVKFLNPATDSALPQKPKYISDAMHLSDLTTILNETQTPAQPPEHIFGPEPAHSWCYYFEKAELARQSEQWQQIGTLAEGAFALDETLYPVNAPELLPYIEAYAHLGQWDLAREYSLEAYRLQNRMDRALCLTWERIEASTPSSPEGQAAVARMFEKFNCAQP